MNQRKRANLKFYNKKYSQNMNIFYTFATDQNPFIISNLQFVASEIYLIEHKIIQLTLLYNL